MSLSPQQLGQLIPLAPTLMAWLRQVDRKAGDLFLQDSSASFTEVQQTLRELLNALNYNGDLTMVQIRYICEAHEPAVWASAVRFILTNSEPKLVSEKIGSALVGSLGKLDGAKNAADCCKILGPFLDMLPRTHYQALGDFCALLRDNSDDAASLACLVGPLIFVAGVAQGKRVPQKQTAAAAAVMDLMIEECEPIFGRAAAKSRADAFGIRVIARKNHAASNARQRPEQPARPVPPPGMTGPALRKNGSSAAKPDSRMPRRKQQLRAFYQWRDPSRAEKVDALLENHLFQDVAKAIYRKYGMLPPGWRIDLEELQKEVGIQLDWFAKATRDDAKGASKQNGFVTPAVPAIKHEPVVKTNNHLDNVIDEIADTEQVYHDKLSDMIEGFVKELRVISSGQRGKAAADGLGLSLAQVEQIFGWRLDEIVGVSNNLLSKLEVVTLVRTEPKTGQGRLGLVSKAFMEIAPELHVYSPYVTSHASSAVQLEKSKQELQAKEGKSGGRGGRRRGQQGVENWMKLWERFSAQSDNLKGRGVSDLLIEPVQRFLRYKLLLKTLKKQVPPSHKELPDIDKAYLMVSDAVDQIHEALKQHERVANKLGLDADDMPLPGNLKKGGGPIRNDWSKLIG